MIFTRFHIHHCIFSQLARFFWHFTLTGILVARCELEVRNSTFPNPRSSDRKFWKLSESVLFHHDLFFTSVIWLKCGPRGKESATSLVPPACSVNWREDILLSNYNWLKPAVNVPLSLINVTSCYAVRPTGRTKVIIFMLLYHSVVVVLTLFIVMGTAIFNQTAYGWSNCS